MEIGRLEIGRLSGRLVSPEVRESERMDLQTLIEGKFDPVGAIRLLAYRVALLEAREEHSVVEGMPEEPQVQSVAARAAAGTDGEKATPAKKSAPAESVKDDDVDAAAATGTGGDAAGASEGPAKKSAPAKVAASKKKASA